ncbi:MAG: homoserine dehydrogenase [archaeon]|jgi:homoserine dehydrogenase
MVSVINVALVGLGTIGSGVVEILLNNSKLIEKRTGVKIVLKNVCDLDEKRALSLGVEKILIKDYKKILADKEIDVIVELIGGYEPAHTIIVDSLNSGKHVVTANKAVIAKYGYELFELAQKNKVNFLFEASVGGCIPIIRTIEESYSSDNIESIYGILNGTTNFILTKMNEGLSYESALKKAQELGFAEANPSFDVDGFDAAQKLFILASLAFDAKISQSAFTEGITKITSSDLEYASKIGYTIKLLAVAKKTKEGISLRVHPALISKNHVFANVSNEVNAVLLSAKHVGEIFLSGKGAGKLPTATVVVTDIIELASRTRVTQRYFDEVKVIPFSENVSRFFMRFVIADKPGVLATITKVLGDEGISIESLDQKKSSADSVRVMLITHPAKEVQIASALNEAKKLSSVSEISLIRVEDF